MASFRQILTFLPCFIHLLVVLDLTPAQFLYSSFTCKPINDYTNLNTTLSSLSSNNDQYDNYNSSIDQEPDRVTAVAFRRGDVELELYRACVDDSISKLRQVCQRTLMHSLRNKAASEDGRRKYATGYEQLQNYETMYSLVQRTPDLSESVAYKPTCNLRYELGTSAFYNQSSPSPLPQAQPPPPALPPPSVTSEGVALRQGLVVLTALPALHALHRDTSESLQYDFSTIRLATDNFSDTNKLGQGGFGPVYKGILLNGKEIAVKRLSKESGQGEEEFKNEVWLMVRLLHRNLVRLLGFSLQGTERLLVSEFVVNGSLDHFIFDTIKGATLDWGKRYKIIGGIAKGLVYLHEDSPRRIIHRDLKASNILLDAEMNAKIADFGMARCFVLDETQGSTTKIAGTYGYMAPEVLKGHISVKSDVYSFGVLVLETISGQKISKTFENEENAESLLSYAWKMLREGTANLIVASNLIEPTMRNNSGSIHDIMRCIHIGLLCVQENVAKRPTMAAVVLMLSNLSMTLPFPTKPAFFMNNSSSSSSTLEMEMPLPEQTHKSSVNEAS